MTKSELDSLTRAVREIGKQVSRLEFVLTELYQAEGVQLPPSPDKGREGQQDALHEQQGTLHGVPVWLDGEENHYA